MWDILQNHFRGISIIKVFSITPASYKVELKYREVFQLLFSKVLFRIKLVAADVIFSSQIFKDADEFANVKLEHMNFIATLGVGGFGRVELVSRVSLIIYLFCYHSR